MNNQLEIRELSYTDEQLLVETEKLFLNLYQHINSKGLLLPLVEKGEKIWMESVKNTLGRYAILAVAIDNNNVVGFGYGMLKFLPDYLGGYNVGVITHFFIDTEYRKKKIGKALCEKLCNWFAQQKVHSVEVEVAAINPEAEKFWKQMGFQYELVQLRKTI